jgi:hypothetical protein
LEVAQPSGAVLDTPVENLRFTLLQYTANERLLQSVRGQIVDRTARSDFGQYKEGDAIPCRLTEDAKATSGVYVAYLLRVSENLTKQMAEILKTIPLWTEFLDHVYGVGPVLGAYLCAFVDVQIREKRGLGATKPSHLRRYCGLAVIDGKLEKRTAGRVNAYNGSLRIRLFQAFTSMWKTSGGREGKDTRYLRIWRDYLNRMANSARVSESGKIEVAGKERSAKGFVFSTGWHKAADVLIEDLYIMARTLEGLPVWPTYQTAKLGYTHGGKVSDGQPVVLTLEEAKRCVGL